MGTNWSYDEDDDDVDVAPEQSLPKPARDHLKKVEKELRSAQELLAQYQARERQQTVSSVLQSKGINSKVANLIPSEITAPDEVEKWITDYADVFGIKQETPAEEAPATPPQGISPADVQNLQSLQDFNSGTPTQPVGVVDDFASRLSAATSEADVMKLVAEARLRGL